MFRTQESIMDSGLHPALDRRPVTAFCGATALAAVTGKSVVEAEKAVMAFRKRYGVPRKERKRGAVVKTVWSNEIEPCADTLGVRATELTVWQQARRTLAAFVEHAMLRDRLYIVLVTGHYIAVGQGLFVDSANREPTGLATCRYRRSRVQRVWVINRERTANGIH
jgi:hypothetical protein